MEEKPIWKAISDDELLAEVTSRGLEVPGAVGATATQAAGVEADGLNAEQRAFQGRVGSFLDPEEKVEAGDQLAVTTEFWHKLGLVTPQLSSEQVAALAAKAEQNPDKRIVPTPLLDLAGRKAVAERARSFPGQQLNNRVDALWAPDTSWLYGKLLADPESVVKEGRDSYGLRYKTPEGEVVGRADYITALKEAGQAVVAEDGTVWAYPVMDVRVNSPRTRDTAANLFEAVNATVAPESLITMQLLHQANGSPNTDWEVDFANEAVYELDKKGNPKALVSVASVDWYPYDRQMDLYDWGADGRGGDFGVRGAESEL